MTSMDAAHVDQIEAEDAWNILSFDDGAALVDVRRTAEVKDLGQPDLTAVDRTIWHIEWCGDQLPSMQAHFVVQIEDAVNAATVTHLIFYCNDGKRALRAAQIIAGTFQRDRRRIDISCIKGALDPLVDCWCAANLPWTPPRT